MHDSTALLQLSDRYTKVSSADLGVASPILEGLQGPFRAYQHARDAVGAVCIRAALCGTVAVSTLAFGRSVEIVPSGMDDGLLVTTAVKGTAGINGREGSFQAGVGETLIAHAEDEPTFVYAPDTEVLKLRFSRRRLEQLGARLYGEHHTHRLHFQLKMTAPGAAQRWASLVRYLLVTLNGADVSPVSAQELASLEQHLMLTLLNIQPHNYSPAQHDSRRELVLRHFRDAADFIDDHLADELTVNTIADAAHCSVRSLARAFETAGELAPMQYVHRLRMEKIRAELSAEGAPRKTIAEIAYRWGYSHLGEFNRKYRQTYGETPSATRQLQLAEIRQPSVQLP
jgi:AraC-like DNA-binding protein